MRTKAEARCSTDAAARFLRDVSASVETPTRRICRSRWVWSQLRPGGRRLMRASEERRAAQAEVRPVPSTAWICPSIHRVRGYPLRRLRSHPGPSRHPHRCLNPACSRGSIRCTRQLGSLVTGPNAGRPPAMPSVATDLVGSYRPHAEAHRDTTSANSVTTLGLSETIRKPVAGSTLTRSRLRSDSESMVESALVHGDGPPGRSITTLECPMTPFQGLITPS